jgi:glycogen debranching enzyme
MLNINTQPHNNDTEPLHVHTSDKQIQTMYQMCESTIEVLTENGVILASSKEEIYGCVFGRDTAITVLFLLEVYKKTKDNKYLELCLTSLKNLFFLQGTDLNIESGEEPGKIIHEYRPDNYERLIKRAIPWYVYPDGILRNYDSVDSTPLTLLGVYGIYELVGIESIENMLPSVKKSLEWLLLFSDKNNDDLVDYTYLANRKYGGLHVQSWTDSTACLTTPDGSFPTYPIAPCEVQVLSWRALRVWSMFYKQTDKEFSEQLDKKATSIKSAFNKKFIFSLGNNYYVSQIVDGINQQVNTVTCNPAYCLWMTDELTEETIFYDKNMLKECVEVLMKDDMFTPLGGIRTMSTLSPTYVDTEHSYHNGSIWPMINSLASLGMWKNNFKKEAEQIVNATIKALEYFNSPIELFIITEKNEYKEYSSFTGKKGCKYQAWTAAGVLAMLSVITPESF